MIRALFPLAVVLALAGCGRDATVYPSLGQRPVEKLGFAEPEAPAPAPVAADPALDARIATLAASLDTVTKGFDTEAAKAEAAAGKARGRPVGSDPWLDAQSALAGLDDWRAQASALVGDIDGLATDRAQALAADYPALTALHDRATAEAARQAATIARLQAIIPGG